MASAWIRDEDIANRSESPDGRWKPFIPVNIREEDCTQIVEMTVRGRPAPQTSPLLSTLTQETKREAPAPSLPFTKEAQTAQRQRPCQCAEFRASRAATHGTDSRESPHVGSETRLTWVVSVTG